MSFRQFLVPFTMVMLSASLAGCSVFPGTYASIYKEPEVRETKEDPADIDYTLIQVTPLLVQELVAQAKENDKGIQGTLPSAKLPSYPYRLGPQDVISVNVWNAPDLSSSSSGTSGSPAGASSSGSSVATQNVGAGSGRIIDVNGKIFFPLVGMVQAAGLTIEEFRVSLTKRLSAYLKDPQVEVTVSAFRSQKVFIAGAVRLPGAVPITDQPLRILDAIALSGGTTDNSNIYDVLLTRDKKTVRLNLDKLYYGGDVDINFMLTKGDVLTVPDLMNRKVYVLGEVGNSVGSNQARSYVMRRGNMSLTEVLSDSGGLSPFSSAANQVYVIRANAEASSIAKSVGNVTVYVLDAIEPQAFVMADQFPVQPRDVIFVNPTGPTMIGRFIGQFLPLLSSANTANSGTF
jgi:polysaccharide biosynthesis/export protein